MTNQDTLVLLSGMAPKKPEKWALDEWDEQFKADYPKPWEPNGGAEWLSASVETSLAGYGSQDFLPNEIHRAAAECHAMSCMEFRWWKNEPLFAWVVWREECLGEWTRNEWPLIWAKRRMQSAQERSE